MQALTPYLANIEKLTDTSHIDDKKTYVHPKLKNLGCVSIVLIREAIAPVVFRNAEQEITDIECSNNLHVRAVPNKFKYIERGRGLQILRALNVGGKQAQNKTVLYKGQKPSDAFDLNTLVFGDSANYENRVLPVRTAVNYSDALSIKPKEQVVDSTFHNRAMEDGTLFDAETKKNSDNLFTRHFIKPGTLMVQTLSTRGQVLPEIGLKHLFLSVGLAGSYGGQTAITGINIKTHIVGIYADQFEQAITSPYELLKVLQAQADTDLSSIQATLHAALQAQHSVAIQGADAQQWQQALIKAFEQTGSELEQEYKAAKPKVAALFDQWFN